MPTLQELIEERRKKRLTAMSDTTAVADVTRADTPASVIPTIEAKPQQPPPSLGQEIISGNVNTILEILRGIVDQPAPGALATPQSMGQQIISTRQLIEGIPHVGQAISDLMSSTKPQEIMSPEWQRTAKGGALTALSIIPMITGATEALQKPQIPYHVMPNGEVMPGATHPGTPPEASTALQTNKRMAYRATAVEPRVPDASGLPPNVAAALRTTAAGRAKSYVGDMASKVANGARSVFEYEHTISDFPELQDDILVHKSILPQKAAEMARNVVVDIVKDLDRQSYLEFQDMVNLRNHRMTALRQIAEDRPVKLPNGMTLDEVNSAIKTLDPQMSPQARAALEKHGNVVLGIGKDLVARGVIPESALSTEYFPNQVLSYLNDHSDFLASGGKKMKVPYREYGQKRQGSELPIETDYRRAMLKYLTSYAVDNATVDFLGKQIQKYDIGPTLATVDESGASRIPRNAIPPGYKEFVPESAKIVRGPNKYPIKNPTPLEQAMMDEINAQGDSGPYVRPDAAVIPEEIAARFQNFGSETTPAIMKAVNQANGWWKAWTIGAGGAKFTIFQLTGDALNLFREDARAFLSTPTALKEQIMRGPLYQRAKDKAVVGSGFVGREVPDILTSSPELARLGGPWEKLRSQVYQYNPFRFYRDFQIERENFLRLTKFVADMQRGLDVKTAGKQAREFTVDYNKFTPQENTYFRGALAPFYAFAKQNTVNWMKYVANHPTDAVLKFAAPYAAASLWNKEKFPKVDPKIPAWMKDQMYIILKADDSTATVLSFATPLDDAVRKFGVAHPRKLIEQMVNAQTPGFEADTTLTTGMAALKEVPGEAVKEWANLLTPAIKLPIELTANYSIFSGRPIEKTGERTLPDSLKTQTKEKYAIGSLFRPYREISLFKEAGEKGNLTGRFLPIYEVDLRNPFAGKEFIPQEEIFNQILRATEAKDDDEVQRLFMRYGGTVSPKALQDYITLYMIQRGRAQQRMYPQPDTSGAMR